MERVKQISNDLQKREAESKTIRTPWWEVVGGYLIWAGILLALFIAVRNYGLLGALFRLISGMFGGPQS